MSDGTRRSLAEWLRDAWADPAAGCPPPESWLAEEQGGLGDEERDRLRQHLAGCPACQAERDLAAAFDAGGTGADVEWVVARLRGGEAPRATPAGPGERGNEPATPVVSLVERRRSRGAAWLRLAAAAAVALGVGLAYQTIRQPAPPDAPPAGVLRGEVLEAVAPVGEVGEVPRELRWEGRTDARAYQIRIETAAGDLLWQGDTTRNGEGRTSVEVPAAVRERMHRGVTYRWTVQALDAAGRGLGESEPATFRLAPEPEPPAPADEGDRQP